MNKVTCVFPQLPTRDDLYHWITSHPTFGSTDRIVLSDNTDIDAGEYEPIESYMVDKYGFDWFSADGWWKYYGRFPNGDGMEANVKTESPNLAGLIVAFKIVSNAFDRGEDRFTKPEFVYLLKHWENPQNIIAEVKRLRALESDGLPDPNED